MRFFCLGLVLVCSIVIVACNSFEDDPLADGDNIDGDIVVDGDGSEEDLSEPDGDLDYESESDSESSTVRAYTTLVQRLEPTLSDHGYECEDVDEDYCENPGLASPDLSVFTQYGFGEWEISEGEDFGRELAPGVEDSAYADRRSLFTWVHLSDIHITDEESPNRLANFDTAAIPSALRPMDMYTELVLDAVVRTINYFHAKNPIDLVLTTGDFSDNAQYNEVANFIQVMNGGTVDPDSGDDDDPVAGPGNDPQDPFEAVGLQGIPWIVAFGNHDELILGNWEITADSVADAQGDTATGGTRDGHTFGVVGGTIPADESRIPLVHDEMIRVFAEDPAQPEGHGLTQQNITDNQAYYAYDPSPDSIVRFIILDTAYRPYGYDSSAFTFVDAVIDRDQHDNFLVPELERASNDKKLVIIGMHHGSRKLQDDGYPEDYITPDTLQTTLLSYPNVLIHCIGHSHENTLTLHEADNGESGYYEIQASSLIDWPQQFRFYELVDNGNGTLSVYTVVVDHHSESGTMSDTSRRYSLIDVQTGWGEGGPGVSEQRNMELVFNIPAGFEDAVANATAKAAIQATSSWAE